MTTTKPVGQAHTQAIIPLKTAKNLKMAALPSSAATGGGGHGVETPGGCGCEGGRLGFRRF
jgi:hypothetical protein